MSGPVVFVANGLTRENVRLQPWRYLYEIALRISARKKVILITEGLDDWSVEEWGYSLQIVFTRLLSFRSQDALRKQIQDLKPRQLWWSVTPRTIVYWKMLGRIPCEKFALITCPLYTYGQLARASLAGVPLEELGVLWKQRLVPRFLFVTMLRSKIFSKVFVQSEANKDVLTSAGLPGEKVSLLQVGIDADDRCSVDAMDRGKLFPECAEAGQAVVFLYFGAVRVIRGFNALMDAFAQKTVRDSDARLVVLARGADDEKIMEINELLDRRGLSDRVRVVGGWLSREQVWAYIESSDVAVLPFVIVPSDVPIAVLEAMARGKPVIGSAVDGIPELIEGRGMVVDPLDSTAFAATINKLTTDNHLRKTLGMNAHQYMSSYPDWNCIGERALEEAGLS